MNLKIDISFAERYKSVSQKARLLTEKWTHLNVLCPSCGGSLERHPNNKPVADFECRVCREDFELKATSARIGKSIPDGAYSTMIERLLSNNNPSLFLLQYDSNDWLVNNLLVIPKYYFSPAIIQKRAPLSSTARRAGWTGCNILVGEIPVAGRIPIILDGVLMTPESIVSTWRKTRFLKEEPSENTKSWLLKTMSCIDELGKKRFELKDMYEFETKLRKTFHGNKHIKEKLRQQLQVLRNKGYLRFLGQGIYELN